MSSFCYPTSSTDFLLYELKSISPELNENNPLTYVYLLQNPNLTEQQRLALQAKIELLKSQYDSKYNVIKEKLMSMGATCVSFSTHAPLEGSD